MSTVVQHTANTIKDNITDIMISNKNKQNSINERLSMEAINGCW